MLAFQAADIYQVQAFRGYEKQYFRLASAWSVVFLLTTGVTFFAKSADEFSRVWLAGFYVIGLVTLVAFRRALFLKVRQWTRAGRLDRRTVIVGADTNGDALIKSLAAQRDSDVQSSAYSTTVATTARHSRCPTVRNWAASTIWSNSPAEPASIS